MLGKLFALSGRGGTGSVERCQVRRRPKQLFREPALSPIQQVQTLAERGLEMGDQRKARQHLEHINYHRLLPYWEGFLEEDGRFRAGSTFEAVLRRYTFDRKLRLLMLDAAERLEVSVRSRWSNQMALHHGPLCLGDHELFQDQRAHARALESLVHFYMGSQDEFVIRFRQRYARADAPPIWICSEMLSLGQLAHWLGNLREPRDLHNVCFNYELDAESFLSFLTHLTEVRNLSAHHSRLWNRKLPEFRFPQRFPDGLDSLEAASQGRLYNTVVMLDFLLGVISPGHSWTRRLAHSLSRHPELAPEMGFPLGWERRSPFKPDPG